MNPIGSKNPMGVTTPSSSLKSLFTGTTDAGGRIGGGDNLSSTTSRGDNCCGAFLRVDRRLVKARAARIPWILSRIAPMPMEGSGSTLSVSDQRHSSSSSLSASYRRLMMMSVS